MFFPVNNLKRKQTYGHIIPSGLKHFKIKNIEITIYVSNSTGLCNRYNKERNPQFIQNKTFSSYRPKETTDH